MYISNKLQISIAYAYVFGRQKTKDDNDEGTRVYNLIRRPKHTYRAQLQWTPTSRWMIRTNIQVLGSRMDTDFGTFPFRNVTLNSYTLLDVYASYAFLKKKQLRVFTDVKNLLNQEDHVEVLGYGVPGLRFMLGIHFIY